MENIYGAEPANLLGMVVLLVLFLLLGWMVTVALRAPDIGKENEEAAFRLYVAFVQRGDWQGAEHVLKIAHNNPALLKRVRAWNRRAAGRVQEGEEVERV